MKCLVSQEYIVTITNELGRQYIAGTNRAVLRKKYGITDFVCCNILYNLNIPIRRGRIGLFRKHSLNENIFEILTTHSMYWIGFIAADGHIQPGRNSYYLQIDLAESEKGQLDKLRNFLESSAPIKSIRQKYIKRNGDACYRSSLHIGSKTLGLSLLKLGLRPRKHDVNELNSRLLVSRDFWRGVIDGDGSIGFHKRGDAMLTICGSQFMCKQFVSYVKSIFPNYDGSVQQHSQSKVTFVVGMCGQYAKGMIEHLYKDCEVALDRKRELAHRVFGNV